MTIRLALLVHRSVRQKLNQFSYVAGRVAYNVFRLVTFDCTRRVINPLYCCRHSAKVIPRLHDETGSTSWLVQLTYIIVRCLLELCSMSARCLLDRVNGVLYCTN